MPEKENEKQKYSIYYKLKIAFIFLLDHNAMQKLEDIINITFNALNRDEIYMFYETNDNDNF